MKLVRYSHAGTTHPGAVKDGRVVELNGAGRPTMLSIVEGGADALAAVSAYVDAAEPGRRWPKCICSRRSSARASIARSA